MVFASRPFVLVVAAAVVAACSADDGGGADADIDGTIGGRVLITQDGPLVGAAVSIDLLEYLGTTPMVRSHVGDVTTDGTGHFQHPTGTGSGYFLITARGGQFRDYATGQAVVLDPTDELTAILYTDTFEDLTTGLVTPVSHLAYELIKARTASGADASLVASHALVTEHLDAHFGGLHWERIAPASLETAATSPTAEVRAAFILAAWSLVARDVAAAAGASPQEVNPFSLAIDLGKDIAAPPFDGNDGNNRAGGTGVQLGACPPPDGACVPSGTCDLGACRTACDAYAGTPRTALGAAVTYLINDTARNHTGLTTADTLSFVRAMATNPDAILFGDACVDEVDRVAPALTWGATPADGAVVRGTTAWTVQATDNVDPAPVVSWVDGNPDSDGTARGAATSIDTALATDRTYTVTARATDAAGNSIMESRSVVADNTAPVLMVASTGYVIDGATWWTAQAAPHLTGTVADDHGPITVEARILGNVVATGTFASGAWDLALPAGSVAPAGSTIAVSAVDAPGNATVDGPATSPFVRIDSEAPSLEGLATTFRDESGDTVSFSGAQPSHTHAGAAVTLGTAAPPTCPTVTKFAYLTDSAPSGTEVTANPVALAYRANDTGIGLNPASLTVTIAAPNGASYGPFALTGVGVVGVPGALDATATLRRNGAVGTPVVPPIGDPAGVRDGVYTVTFAAVDRLGTPATLTRCFDYRALGPPMKITQAVALAPVVAMGTPIRTLTSTYELENGMTAAVLNGTATGGIVEFHVANVTSDPAYVTILPPILPAPTTVTMPGLPPVTTYYQRFRKTIHTYLHPTTQATVTGPTCPFDGSGTDPLCFGYDQAIPPDLVVAEQPLTTWTPSLVVHQMAGSVVGSPDTVCAGCDANEYLIAAGAQRAVVVGFAHLPDLGLDVAGTPAQVDGDFTAAAIPGAPTTRECIAWSPVGSTAQRCTRVQTFQQYRSLASETVTLAPSGPLSLMVDWRSAVTAAASAASAPDANTQSGRRLSTQYQWLSTETYP